MVEGFWSAVRSSWPKQSTIPGRSGLWGPTHKKQEKVRFLQPSEGLHGKPLFRNRLEERQSWQLFLWTGSMKVASPVSLLWDRKHFWGADNPLGQGAWKEMAPTTCSKEPRRPYSGTRTHEEMWPHQSALGTSRLDMASVCFCGTWLQETFWCGMNYGGVRATAAKIVLLGPGWSGHTFRNWWWRTQHARDQAWWQKRKRLINKLKHDKTHGGTTYKWQRRWRTENQTL